MMDDADSSQDQQYWLQLLSDLGSQGQNERPQSTPCEGTGDSYDPNYLLLQTVPDQHGEDKIWITGQNVEFKPNDSSELPINPTGSPLKRVVDDVSLTTENLFNEMLQIDRFARLRKHAQLRERQQTVDLFEDADVPATVAIAAAAAAAEQTGLLNSQSQPPLVHTDSLVVETSQTQKQLVDTKDAIAVDELPNREVLSEKPNTTSFAVCVSAPNSGIFTQPRAPSSKLIQSLTRSVAVVVDSLSAVYDVTTKQVLDQVAHHSDAFLAMHDALLSISLQTTDALSAKFSRSGTFSGEPSPPPIHDFVDLLQRLEMVSLPRSIKLLVSSFRHADELVTPERNSPFIKHRVDAYVSAMKSRRALLSRPLSNSSDCSEEADELQYIVAQFCTRPNLSSHSHDTMRCCVCNQSHTLSKILLLQCNCCARYACVSHGRAMRRIARFGIQNPLRVCDNCAVEIDEDHQYDWELFRAARIEDYLNNSLLEYQSIAASKPSGDDSLQVSFIFPTRVLIETVDLIQRNRLSGFASMLLRTTQVESVEAIKSVLVKDGRLFVSAHELTALVHYRIAVETAFRGCDADNVIRRYFKSEQIEDSVLQRAIMLAPLALTALFEKHVTAIERLSSLRGYRLLFSNCEDENWADQEEEKTTYSCLVSHDGDVVLALRGDRDLAHALAALSNDLSRPMSDFPPSLDFIARCLCPTEHANALSRVSDRYVSQWADLSAHSCNVLASVAAETKLLLQRLGPSLWKLLQEPQRSLSVVGHAFGASVGAMLSMCLSPFITLRECYAFSPSKCANGATAHWMSSNVRSIVVGDSLYSRLSGQTARKLSRELAMFRNQVFRDSDQQFASVMRRSQSWLDEMTSMETATVDSELPVLLLPGQLWHCADQRGQWRLFSCASDASAFEKIEVCESLLEHHKPQFVLQALLEARAVKNAQQIPPLFASFLSANTCGLCKHEFEWTIHFRNRNTSSLDQEDPEVQEDNFPRERQNCYHCGALVCSMCSQHQRAMPKFGMLKGRQICDACELSGDYASY